jgi:hypothetical protein
MDTLCEFIKTNLSAAMPGGGTVNMSGRIFTVPTERPFMAPAMTLGPTPESPGPWLSQFQHWYKVIVPITIYTVYDPNPLNTATTEQTAKIIRWNLTDAVRNLIDYNKNLSSDGVIQVVHNSGVPRHLNLTKWRPNVLGMVTPVIMEYVDDISSQGNLP